MLASPQGSCLLDVFQRFEEAVDKYQAFWSALERVDAELWVVDPERPSRRDVRRRVVISECPDRDAALTDTGGAGTRAYMKM